MMKMYDKIKHLKKEYVYEYYTRIVDNFKDYEKITRVKMLDEIYAVYNDYHTIINICTVRELKYLKMISEEYNLFIVHTKKTLFLKHQKQYINILNTIYIKIEHNNYQW